MIIIYHNNKVIIEVVDENNKQFTFDKNICIVRNVLEIANQFPEEIIVWCDIQVKNQLNRDFLKNQKLKGNEIISYSPENANFFSDDIGYIENSPFIKINKNVTYATWQMSSLVGCAHASIFNKTFHEKIYNKSFDFYLNNVSKAHMLLGLFCISEPKLLIGKSSDLKFQRANSDQLFRFIKTHIRARWTFLLLLNLMIYEKRFPFLSFLKSIFYNQYKPENVNFDIINNELFDIKKTEKIDVLIPTIGRKKYLYDVLVDLKNQTHLPKNVIIIEQNPLENSISELDYLTNEDWPFAINHIFTHQTGACNARNLGLSQLKSDWCFLADDDVRFENDFIEKSLFKLQVHNYKAVTIATLQENEINIHKNDFQWHTFGAGCSIVKSSVLENIRFNMAFEFGFGEDDNFGMQIRNSGVDITFFHEPQLLHLKAPMGGFRTKFVQEWDDEIIAPKPSPTIMLLKILHSSKQEINGFRTILFMKYYKINSIKNPIKYFKYFNKQWKISEFWANHLLNKIQ